MSKSSHLVFLMLVVGAVGACDETAETTKKDTKSSASAASVEVVAPDPPPEPKGITQNTLTFKSKRIKSEGFTLSHTEASMHKMSKGAQKYKALIVHLTNYGRGGGSYLSNPSKDGQRMITLNFSAPGTPAVGSYSIDGPLGGSNKLAVGIHTRDEHIGLISGSGSGEITSMDGTTVSGKVTVKDDQGTMVEATFSVPYETK